MAEKPTLVVGATGQVGRRVVEQLLNANKPVRALVRNHSKARELFGKYMMEDDEKTKLKIFVCDLGEAAKQEDYKVLNQAVEGCGSIVSVSGCARISKLSDFLPWRLFQEDVSGWADSSHPYFGNYKAQCALVDLAKTHSVSRFVRLTGLSAGYSPFHPVGIIFSSVLSMTTRYHFLCEQYIRNSSVPYLIIRPGGLRNEDRVRKFEAKHFNLLSCMHTYVKLTYDALVVRILLQRICRWMPVDHCHPLVWYRDRMWLP